MALNESSSHGIVNYTSRDYESIMRDFWNVVPKMTELWTPESEADPGVVLGKFIASCADMLGVNLDWLANEVFGPTVTQRKNAEKLFGLIGYSLGWYTAARTEVTFTNNTEDGVTLDFGFNGNFSTLNAYEDITMTPRVITYNILPNTNKMGDSDSSRKRTMIANATSIFDEVDSVALQPGGSVTRVAIEGELRSHSVRVKDVKDNNYVIKLPSQHLDTTAVWVRGRDHRSATPYDTQWVQTDSPAEFNIAEARFSVTYDNYSNAQITISQYIGALEEYVDEDYLVVYWIECSGIIGSVARDVLSNFLPAKTPTPSGIVTDGGLTISNLANTVEMPHTHTVTGKSPETAKEAYINSRKYINTWDSLITLPDFNRFLLSEPGIDCGIVLDCQKALDINMAIYYDPQLTDQQKQKMYITYNDFKANDKNVIDWRKALDLTFDPTAPQKFVFATNFKNYTAMCYAIHNDFNDDSRGDTDEYRIRVSNKDIFKQYKPPSSYITSIISDFKPLQAMTVKLDFGYARIFDWFVSGVIYPINPVSKDVADNLVAKAKEALKIYFAPANRSFGVKPTTMEIVECIQNADPMIRYFDAGKLNVSLINWAGCDIGYFNPISYARLINPTDITDNIVVSPEWILRS